MEDTATLESEATDPWVTIALFYDPVDAGLARTRLESEGLETFLKGEELATMLKGIIADNPVELQVRASQASYARELLDQEEP